MLEYVWLLVPHLRSPVHASPVINVQLFMHSIPLPFGRLYIKGTLWLLPGMHTDLIIAVEDRGTFWHLVDMQVLY